MPAGPSTFPAGGPSDTYHQPLPQTHHELPPHPAAFNLWSEAPSLPGPSTPSPRFAFDTAQRSALSQSRNLVSSELNNEADAIEILARGNHARSRATRKVAPKGGLEEFALVKQGIVTVDQLVHLTDVFFRWHHHYYVSIGRTKLTQPIVPLASIPHSAEQLAVFAEEERHLLVAIAIVASRNDVAMRDIHERSWTLFRVSRSVTRLTVGMAIRCPPDGSTAHHRVGGRSSPPF